MDDRLRNAARNVYLRMCGTLASDIWNDDDAAELADYELVALQYDQTATDLSVFDRAELWVCENTDALTSPPQENMDA